MLPFKLGAFQLAVNPGESHLPPALWQAICLPWSTSNQGYVAPGPWLSFGSSTYPGPHEELAGGSGGGCFCDKWKTFTTQLVKKVGGP